MTVRRIFGLSVNRRSLVYGSFDCSSSQFSHVYGLPLLHDSSVRKDVDQTLEYIDSTSSESVLSIGLLEMKSNVPKTSEALRKHIELNKTYDYLHDGLKKLVTSRGNNSAIRIITPRETLSALRIHTRVNEGREEQAIIGKSAIGDVFKWASSPSSPSSSSSSLITQNNSIDPSVSLLLGDVYGICTALAIEDKMAFLRSDTSRVDKLIEEAEQSKLVKSLKEAISKTKTNVVTLEMQKVIESKINQLVDIKLRKIAESQILAKRGPHSKCGTRQGPDPPPDSRTLQTNSM